MLRSVEELGLEPAPLLSFDFSELDVLLEAVPLELVLELELLRDSDALRLELLDPELDEELELEEEEDTLLIPVACQD